MFHTKHADVIDPSNIVKRGGDADIVTEGFTCHLYGHVKQNDAHEVIKLHF